MIGRANKTKKNNHVLKPKPNLRVTKSGINTKKPNMAKLLKCLLPGPSAGNGALWIVGESVVKIPHASDALGWTGALGV